MNNPAPGFARHPEHRVSATQSPRHVRVLVGETVIADSRAAFLVEESRHDPVWYFPPDHVDTRHLIPTESTSYCPFKGHASYWTINAGDGRIDDAVWAYLAPFDECRALTGYFAFYPDRVSLEVDGELQRPV
ncbi:MAG: DUF427 domain-containing protein [Pseudomonadales bacterium]